MTEFERRRMMDDGWMWWYLVGPAGAVQFATMPLHIPPIMDDGFPLGATIDGIRVMGVDIGYHSPTPRYEGQDPMNPCPVYGDVLCFYDGSGLNADVLLKRFVEHGCDEEVIWAGLTNCYRAWFEEADQDQELFVSPLSAMLQAMKRPEGR